MLSNGCALIAPHVEPFSFESVAIVFPSQEARFTPLRSDQQERYKGGFVMVRVQSKTNLAELADERQLNLWVKAWFCDETEGLFLWTTGELRYQDADIGHIYAPKNERSHVRALLQQVPVDALKVYHFYIDALAYLTDESFERHAPYNLKNAPRDICVVIGGGGYAAKGFTSNVIIVPKEKIQSAFQAGQ